MKKTLLLLFFLSGLYPSLKNGALQLSNLSFCYAQGGGYDVEICYSESSDTDYFYDERGNLAVIATTTCKFTADCATLASMGDEDCKTTEVILPPVPDDPDDPDGNGGGDTGGGGGSGDGNPPGGNGGTNPPPSGNPPPPTAASCTNATQQAGANTTNVYNNPALQSGVNSPLLFPPIIPGSGYVPTEHGFSVTMDSNGNLITQPIEDGGLGYGGGFTAYANEIADVHTHPNSNSGPSGEDIMSIAEKLANGSPNFSDSYIITADGTRYSIHVDNSATAQSFFYNNPNTINPETHGYAEGSALRTVYSQAFNYFINHGSSGTDASIRAYAVSMQNSGMSIYKAPATTPPSSPSQFGKIGAVIRLNPDGTYATGPNGGNVYIEVNCP